MLKIKRVYDPPAAADGYRVLVDRLWPRGVSKQKAALDAWLKDVAPSQELRTWFGHKPERYDEFRARYQAELDNNPVMTELRQIIKDHDVVTLLYSAKDTTMNQAVVLQEFLKKTS